MQLGPVDRRRKATTPKFRKYDRDTMNLCTRVAGEILEGEHEQPGGHKSGYRPNLCPRCIAELEQSD